MEAKRQVWPLALEVEFRRIMKIAVRANRKFPIINIRTSSSSLFNSWSRPVITYYFHLFNDVWARDLRDFTLSNVQESMG